MRDAVERVRAIADEYRFERIRRDGAESPLQPHRENDPDEDDRQTPIALGQLPPGCDDRSAGGAIEQPDCRESQCCRRSVGVVPVPWNGSDCHRPEGDGGAGDQRDCHAKVD